MNIQVNDTLYEPYLEGVPLPDMYLAEQIFDRPVIRPEQIREHVLSGLDGSGAADRVWPGMSVAVTVGSRGIANQDITVKAIVDWLKDRGAEPFIVPAMGSHGGGIAEEQLRIIERFGITEEAMGCPIRSSMETVCIGKTEEGEAVFLDRYAFEADGIVVNCRIKLHPAFRGRYESGIIKMMAIGLGKRRGSGGLSS